MRKADLKVGEEYAAGSSSRHDRWRLARVRVEELDGERIVEEWAGKRRQRGIVVTLVADHDHYGMMRGKAGDVKVLTSARDIIEPWAPYAERKAEHDQAVQRTQAERLRVIDVAHVAAAELSRRGIDLRSSDGVFRVPADVMAQIVALLP